MKNILSTQIANLQALLSISLGGMRNMSKFVTTVLLAFFSASIGSAQNRFPRPDFESGYKYPDQSFFIPNEALWTTIDLIMLVLLMSVVAWAVIKKKTRMPIIVTSIISVAYFGFFRSGCI